MTRGVLDPRNYYYRRVYADTVRAVEAACASDLVDPGKIVLTPASQGGGITLAVAGLLPDIFTAMIDVPFLCDMRTATEITAADPCHEIVRFCKIHQDKTETGFAAYNHYAGEKERRICRYNQHKGGQSCQKREKILFFSKLLNK